MKYNLGVIGCGNMGEAIIKGVVGKKVLNPRNIFATDADPDKVKAISAKYKVRPELANSAVAEKSDVIIISVKPQQALEVFNSIEDCVDKKKLIISIMAGFKISKIEDFFVGKEVPVVRVMPNLGAFLGESVSAVSYSSNVNAAYKKISRQIFSGIGEVYETDENKQDAITALTGSGPAYFFYVIEALVEAAEEQGFSANDAIRLATQTMKASALLLEKMELHPSELRKKVTSKGGTTERAIKVLDEHKLREIFVKAIRAAKARAAELSN